MTKSPRGPKAVGSSDAVVRLFSGNVVVTICNLLRDVAIAASFGASSSTDYFFLAISIPVFVISVAAGSYRYVVVPFLVGKVVGGQSSLQPAAARLTWLNVRGIVGVSGLVGVVLGSAYLLAGGPALDAGSTKLLRLMLLVIPMYALSGFVEMSQGSLQAFGALIVPNLSRALLPAGIILGAGLLGSRLGLSGVVLGGTVGALIGALLVAWLLSRHGVPIRRVSTKLPALERYRFLQNFRALMLASSIAYLIPVIGQWLAGLLGPGSVSALGYAGRLTVGATGLFTSSLGPVLLGFFVRESSAYNPSSAGRDFFEIATPLAWAGCFMTLGFWVTSDYLVDLIYQRGELTEAYARQITALANCYALQFPLLLAGTAATSLIAAHSLNRAFLPIGVIVLISNVVLTVILMIPLAAAGIAVASSLTYAFSLSLLLLNLIRLKVIGPDRADLRRFLTPFASLAGAGFFVFLGAFRLTKDLGLLQFAGAIFILAAFASLAFFASKSFVYRAWASWRRS